MIFDISFIYLSIYLSIHPIRAQGGELFDYLTKVIRLSEKKTR